MSDYISRQAAIEAVDECTKLKITDDFYTVYTEDMKDMIADIPAADVVEADKAQKEIDYWHDKAQSYEQTILKLTINAADVVEVEKVNKIYEKLADLFGIPCNYSPCDEIMLESGGCRDDCGDISEAECWRRYFEVVCCGERAEA